MENKSLKEIALDMNPKLEKQSPFIDANKLAIQSAGLLRKNKDVLIAFATDICMERNEHKKKSLSALKIAAPNRKPNSITTKSALTNSYKTIKKT
ncbi:hypothetical protein BTM444_04660 [Helicobacter pylori]